MLQSIINAYYNETHLIGPVLCVGTVEPLGEEAQQAHSPHQRHLSSHGTRLGCARPCPLVDARTNSRQAQTKWPAQRARWVQSQAKSATANPKRRAMVLLRRAEAPVRRRRFHSGCPTPVSAEGPRERKRKTNIQQSEYEQDGIRPRKHPYHQACHPREEGDHGRHIYTSYVPVSDGPSKIGCSHRTDPMQVPNRVVR